MRGPGKLSWLRASVLSVLLGACALHCSASSNGGGGAGNGATGGGGSGTGGGTSGTGAGPSSGGGINIPEGGTLPDYSSEQFFADDPPPADCSDSGAKPKVPGGTPECPDDKNYQGCPCTVPGQKAPCWPGLRKHRNRGLCKDGETTCIQSAEFKTVWGECIGYTGITPPTYLPPPNATGKAACACFSGGYWDVKNTSPCFYTQGSTVIGAVSTILEATGARCPTQSEMSFTTGTPPAQPFSPNTLKVDCNGFFELCFTIKALSAPNAQKAATDCAVMKVCSSSYYGLAGQGPNGTDGVLPMPDLASWITKTPSETACADTFYKNGGYGEFWVKGTSDECDTVDKKFLTFDYCPFKCNDPANASLPECVNCKNGSGGPF